MKITPFFGKLPMSQINATHVRKWQNELMSDKSVNGTPYSQTYIKTINNQLTAIFNYAVRYYNLRENPCHKAGSMGKKNADEMQFWTLAEFNTFKDAIQDNPKGFVTFMTLYYTGMHIGEFMAFTPEDIDLTNGSISITKSFQRIKERDVITPPKTPKSERVIFIPPFLAVALSAYMGKVYGLKPNTRIFPITKKDICNSMDNACKESGVKRIRLHDVRHSHASLLIELGFSPLLIADRLGHEKVETTLNTYSHLYPHKQGEVVEKLQNLFIRLRL